MEKYDYDKVYNGSIYVIVSGCEDDEMSATIAEGLKRGYVPVGDFKVSGYSEGFAWVYQGMGLKSKLDDLRRYGVIK